MWVITTPLFLFLFSSLFLIIGYWANDRHLLGVSGIGYLFLGIMMLAGSVQINSTLAQPTTGPAELGLTYSDLSNMTYDNSVYCSGSELKEDVLITQGATIKTFNKSWSCPYGCNNITNNCYTAPNEEAYHTGLALIVLIMGFSVFALAAAGLTDRNDEDKLN